MRNLCFLNHSTSALIIRSIPVVVILPQGGPYFSESLVGLQAPWHPTPCLYFVLLSSSRALKWLISCNLLTQAFFMQMSRNCFQASVLLTGQAGTFLHVSQLTARRALISSHWRVLATLDRGAPPCWRGRRASCTPVLPVLIFSGVEKAPPLLLWAPIRNSSASPLRGANLCAVWCLEAIVVGADKENIKEDTRLHNANHAFISFSQIPFGKRKVDYLQNMGQIYALRIFQCFACLLT